MPLSNGTMHMVCYAVVEPTGVINRVGNSELSMVGMQATEPGQVVLANTDLPILGATLVDFPEDLSDDTHYWNGQSFSPYPQRPSLFHYWDGESWVDPRTTESIEQERLERLILARQESTLFKLEFVMRVVGAGFISHQSGLDVLDGKIPSELSAMTNGMSQQELFNLSAKIKGASQFDRLDEFVVQAATFLGYDDEDIDFIYGIHVD